MPENWTISDSKAWSMVGRIIRIGISKKSDYSGRNTVVVSRIWKDAVDTLKIEA